MLLNTEPRAIDWQQAAPVWHETSGLIAAWAFGSASNGLVAPGSDVDVGVWFETLPSFEQQLALLGRLQEALGVDEVDLVVLNDANPTLRFEALSGRALYCRDPNLRAGFASLAAREYEDAIAFWEQALRSRNPSPRKSGS